MPYLQCEKPLQLISHLQINFCAPNSTPHRLISVDDPSPGLIELFSEGVSLSDTFILYMTMIGYPPTSPLLC